MVEPINRYTVKAGAKVLYISQRLEMYPVEVINCPLKQLASWDVMRVTNGFEFDVSAFDLYSCDEQVFNEAVEVDSAVVAAISAREKVEDALETAQLVERDAVDASEKFAERLCSH